MLLDGLLERGLQTGHLRRRADWLETHDERVLGVGDEGHDANHAALRGGVVLVRLVCLIARPITTFEVKIETGRLVAALFGPAEVYAVERGGIAVVFAVTVGTDAGE